MTDPLLGNFVICPESGAVLAHDLLGIEPMVPLEHDLHARTIQYRNFRRSGRI